jgi:hypothetical protein
LIRCIFGIRGQGKTWACRSLAGEDPATQTVRDDAPPRVLIYDPYVEHAAVHCVWQDIIEHLDLALARGRFRVALTEPLTHGEAFCVLAFAAGRQSFQTWGGSLLVVIEEIDVVAPPGREPTAFKRLVAQGRHHGIDLITTSRRPAEVSRLLTSQAEEIICYRTHEPNDIRYLRQVMGDQAERISNLPPHTPVIWRPDGTGEDPASLPPEGNSRSS